MNIFESNDYKEILNSYIFEMRKTRKGLSRQLAEHLGVHATLVSQVLTGTRDFSEEQLLSVCEFLGIGRMETKYLLALLRFERAGSKLLKNEVQETISQIRKDALKIYERVQKRSRILDDTEKAIFYSNWTYSAVQLLTTLDQKVTFDFICQRLGLTPAKAREILDFLIQAQLVVESEGYFTMGTRSTHLEKKSPFILKLHTNWRLKALQMAENLSDEELMYSANFSVSKKDFNRLREDLMQTIKKFLEVVKESPAEDIAQFNLDFFWIKN